MNTSRSNPAVDVKALWSSIRTPGTQACHRTLRRSSAEADEELGRSGSKSRSRSSPGRLNIKKETQAKWAGHRHAPTLPAAVSYDLDEKGGALGAEIGPDKERSPAGPLGTIYEYGTPRNAPRPALNPALDNEAPRFEQAAGDAAEKLADV
jgi:hypothetical protein